MNKMMSRRSLMTGVALGGGALALAGCSNILGTGIGITTAPGGGVTVTLPPAVTAFVQNVVAGAAKYVPIAESIAQEAASLFGPAYASIVTIGSAAINTLITSLENLVAPPAAAPPTVTTASAIHVARKAVYTAKPVGMTAQGVVVYGVKS